MRQFRKQKKQKDKKVLPSSSLLREELENIENNNYKEADAELESIFEQEEKFLSERKKLRKKNNKFGFF